VETRQIKSSKPRGRPTHEKSFLSVKESQTEMLIQETGNKNAPVEQAIQPEDVAEGSFDVSLSQASRPGAFSILLGSLLKNERSEILRIAREIGVSDNTVYRWINGTSTPRYAHMQRLVEILTPSELSKNSQRTPQNGGRSTNNSVGRWDVQRDLYRRVLEQAATTVDDTSRRWHIIETIFEQALLFLDPEHEGLALTYARLMPPRADGSIHSLYEAEMRGQTPWPFTLDFKTYLGSTTLAGAAALSQRVRVWSKIDSETRIPVGLDENEQSSCAAPVMRAGRLAGVLIVSSTIASFVNIAGIPQAVGDYANLLAAGLMDSDFYPTELLRLVPMPELPWQRERIAHTYLNRVIECARKQCLSFPEAEQKVLCDLEEDFERIASHQETHSQKAELPGPVKTELEQTR